MDCRVASLLAVTKPRALACWRTSHARGMVDWASGRRPHSTLPQSLRVNHSVDEHVPVRQQRATASVGQRTDARSTGLAKHAGGSVAQSLSFSSSSGDWQQSWVCLALHRGSGVRARFRSALLVSGKTLVLNRDLTPLPLSAPLALNIHRQQAGFYSSSRYQPPQSSIPLRPSGRGDP